MRKWLLFSLPILLGAGNFCNAQSSQASIYKSRSTIYDVPDGEAEIYGYMRYDKKYRTNGLTRFRTSAPEKYALVKDYGTVMGSTPIFTAGTYVGKDYLAYETTLYSNVLMPYGISVIDTKTGAYERKKVFPKGSPILILDEMTYDPKTDRIFGIHYNTDRFITDLYEISRVTYDLTKVATIDNALFTLTADNGFLYAVTSDESYTKSFLVKIDQSTIDATKQTCTVQRVSPATGTGISIGNYSQSMEFDKTTHRLWWMAQAADGHAYLVELIPETGKIISKQLLVDDLQLLSMAIPYQYVADEAPSFVKHFSVEADENGAGNATLTWTNPTVDYRNNALASIDGVKIYRNDQLVQTLNTTEKGKKMTWTDSGLAEDYYIYKVVPYNQKGDGIYKEAAAFVGEDLPGAPTNVKLVANGTEGTVTWGEPDMGAHGGYYDNSTLTYDVMRLPDSVVVANKIQLCTVTDHVSLHAGYSYMVTASNKKGKGLSANSNTVAYGTSEAIPFASDLQTKDEFDRWTTIDNNHDDVSWTFNESSSTTLYDRADINADDWLISPPLSFTKDKKYQLRYTYSSANWIDPVTHKPLMEKMKVYYGTQATPDHLTTLIKDLDEFHTSSGHFYYGKDFFVPNKDGEGYVAFHACSEALKGQIRLKDVSLREYSETDLSIKELKGSVTANKGVEQPFFITVSNEGSKTVSNYTVELFNADTQEVLGTVKGVSVEPDTTASVYVNWVPNAEGEVSVCARVVLAGDTYPMDNILPTIMKVKVAAADADKWITLNSEDNIGWNQPFYLLSPYSQSQCLYLENEIRKKNIDIIAVQLKYNGKNEIAYTFPARISMKISDRENMKNPEVGYLGNLETTGWSKVFDGNITLEGTGDNKELKVTLDTPFKYMGGNINIKFEALPGTDVLTGPEHPEWHFYMPLDNIRGTKYDGNDENIDENQVFISEYVPFLMLEYKDNDPAGISSVGNKLFCVSQRGNTLCISTKCEQLTLMNLSGAVIVSAKNTDRLHLAMIPSGIYILKGIANGVVYTAKIFKK